MRPNGLPELLARVVVTDTGCWEWTGARTGNGYGAFSFENRTQRAHRVSWLLHHGPLGPDDRVLHRCDNPPCVNPDHLFRGTDADNVKDMIAKGRANLTSRRGVVFDMEQRERRRRAMRARWADPEQARRLARASAEGRSGRPRGPYKKKTA